MKPEDQRGDLLSCQALLEKITLPGRLAPFWMHASPSQGPSARSCISPLSSCSFSAKIISNILHVSLTSSLLLSSLPPQTDDLIFYVSEVRDNMSLLPTPKLTNLSILGPVIFPFCFNRRSFQTPHPYSGHIVLFQSTSETSLLVFISPTLLASVYQHKLA